MNVRRSYQMLAASTLTCLIAGAATAQSDSQVLPAFQPGQAAPVLVLGGVEPLRQATSSLLVTTQNIELQPPRIERRGDANVPKPVVQDRIVEQAKPIARPAQQPTEAPRLRRSEPDRPAQPSVMERPRVVERPRDGDKPRDGDRPRDGDKPRDEDRPREGDRARDVERPNAPEGRGENRGPQGDRQDRRGPDGFPGMPGASRMPGMPGMPGMGPRPNMGSGPDRIRGDQPPRGPGFNNMGPGRSGPDSLEEQMRAVERIFSSPVVKRYLELMEENAQLRAQVQVQEKLWQRERERMGDHQPQREEPRAEREREGRAQAERAEREALERKAREVMERQQVEKREMALQIEKLKARLHEAESALEDARESKRSDKKKREDKD